MKFKNSVLLIALVFVFGVGTRAQEHETKVSPAAPARAGSSASSVRLGDKLVVITSPAGFEEAGSQCPKFKELLIATEDPSNDVLFGHLSASDCQSVRNGGQATMNLYTKVSVLRSAREQAISSADMAAIAVEFRKNGAAILDPDGPVMKGVMENAERGLSDIQSKQVALGLSQTQNLGEFNVTPESYSVMLLLTYNVEVQGNKTIMPVLASMTMLKVRQRLVYVNVFRKITSTAALKTELKPGVEEVKQFTTKWVKEILAANPEDK